MQADWQAQLMIGGSARIVLGIARRGIAPLRLATVAVAVSCCVGVIGFAAPHARAKQATASSKMQLGELLFFNGNIDGAINAFRGALMLKPDLWEAHLNLVNMYIQKSDFPSAIEECREVLKVKPNHKDVHLILGNLLRAQNDLDGAESALKKAIECGASPAMAHNALGLTLLQKGKHDEAHAHIQQAIDKQKNFPDAHLTMGVVLFKKGDKEGSLKSFDTAIKQKGKYPEARNAKGDILAADGKWKEALEEYEKAAKEEPKFAQAHSSMGNAHFQMGNIDKARDAYAKAKELNPNDKNILYGLALMYEKQGRISEAIAEFEAALMVETDATMKSQIQTHVNQLRMVGGQPFNLGGLGSAGALGGGGLGPGLYNQNAFGNTDFSTMIKIKQPKGQAKSQ